MRSDTNVYGRAIRARDDKGSFSFLRSILRRDPRTRHATLRMRGMTKLILDVSLRETLS